MIIGKKLHYPDIFSDNLNTWTALHGIHMIGADILHKTFEQRKDVKSTPNSIHAFRTLWCGTIDELSFV